MTDPILPSKHGAYRDIIGRIWLLDDRGVWHCDDSDTAEFFESFPLEFLGGEEDD